MSEVTVLMCVHNGLPHLHEAVQSILNQTFSEFEFLIIDDGSSDGSFEALEEYAGADSRIRLVRNESNLGLGASLHKGVETATGRWIARMDADDVSLPERLEKQLAYVKAHPEVDILGTQATDIDDAGNVIRRRSAPLSHEAIRKVLPFANPIVHPSVLLRRDALRAIGSYDPNCRKLQDYELWFRAMAHGCRFANHEERLLLYRAGSGYGARRSWQYRSMDFKIRLQGCRRIRAAFWEYTGALVPLALGLLPKAIIAQSYSILKRLDPRERGAG